MAQTDGSIYRVFPNGEVQYLHPKDGVYPEKVNKGRSGVGVVDRRIGENTNPVKVCAAAAGSVPKAAVFRLSRGMLRADQVHGQEGHLRHLDWFCKALYCVQPGRSRAAAGQQT